MTSSGTMRRAIGFTVVLASMGLGFHAQAQGKSLRQLATRSVQWGRMASDWNRVSRPVAGEWGDEVHWEGSVCDSFWKYHTNISASLDEVKFDVRENGDIGVTAYIGNTYSRGDGTYQAWGTFCRPWSGWFGVGVAHAKVVARMVFPNDPNAGFDKMSIVIESTQLEGINIGPVPGWMGSWIARNMNRALASVWKSQLGDWVSKELSTYITGQIPDPTT